MKVATLTITPKQGETVTLRFHVVQEIPYPDIASHGSLLEWRNAGGLFSHLGQGPAGIGEIYNCYLLAEGVENPTGETRCEHAGYEGRKGSFVFRGQDMGEMSVRLDRHADVKVRRFATPTPGEATFIGAQIVVPLRAFIEENKAALREEAIARITRNMHQRVATARKQLTDLEAAIATAKF